MRATTRSLRHLDFGVGAANDSDNRAAPVTPDRPHRLNACGYALGAKFTPSWMDYPMFYHANPVEIRPDMVFFAHMVLMDSDSGTAMTLGCTYIVTESAPEPLSKHQLDLIMR